MEGLLNIPSPPDVSFQGYASYSRGNSNRVRICQHDVGGTDVRAHGISNVRSHTRKCQKRVALRRYFAIVLLYDRPCDLMNVVDSPAQPDWSQGLVNATG